MKRPVRNVLNKDFTLNFFFWLLFVFCIWSYFVFYRILCPVGQFSPWGRLRLNRMEITSFNNRVLAFLAVTVFWLVCCSVNSLYLSIVTEFPDMDVAQFKVCIMCTATIDGDQVPSLSCSNIFTYPFFLYSNTNSNLIMFLSLILGTKVPQSLFSYP
jgi:hypothetical protein